MSDNLIKEYLGKMQFEEMKLDDLTIDRITSMDDKEGIVLFESRMPLYILRGLSIMPVLNQPVVFESLKEYWVLDAFGTILYEDDAEGIREYAEGFING